MLILDVNGKKLGEIDTEKYSFVSNVSEEKFIVIEANNDDGHFIVLDKTGKKLFDIKKAKKDVWTSYYRNGYIAFDNGEGKIGVANDKGEIVIRPKYEDIYNFGNGGGFAAKKNDKYGIINDKDETIIEFDYDGFYYMMGNNYLLRDGSTWSMVDKDGKEITSFESFSQNSDSYAEYIDVEGLTTSIYNTIVEYEQAIPASQLAKKLSLDIDKYHYAANVNHEMNYDGKVSFEYRLWYDGYLTEEKTHEVVESDGWFTTRRTVSDGWVWTDNTQSSVHGKLTLNDNGISIKDIYKSLTGKLAKGREKNTESVFVKNIKIKGQPAKCKTEITLNNDDIVVNINFER